MRKLHLVIIGLFLAFLPASHCGSGPGPTPVPVIDAGPPPVITDAGPAPVVDAGDTCSKYCSHLSGLTCNDPSCVGTCSKVLAANLINLHVDCVMGATTLDAAKKCGASCK